MVTKPITYCTTQRTTYVGDSTAVPCYAILLDTTGTAYPRQKPGYTTVKEKNERQGVKEEKKRKKRTQERKNNKGEINIYSVEQKRSAIT